MPHASLVEDPDEEISPVSFAWDVLSYPFRRNGRPFLVVGTIILLLGEFLGNFQTLGFVGLVANLLIFAYLCGLYFELIEISSHENDTVHCFPDLTEPLDDIAWPTLKVIGVLLIAHLPLSAWYLWGDPEAASTAWVAPTLLGVAAFYFPMAMLGTVMHGTLLAASPHIVLPAIFRSGVLYFFAAVLISGLYAGQWYAADFLPQNVWLVGILKAVISMYLLLTNARALGRLYLRRENEIGWFRDPDAFEEA